LRLDPDAKVNGECYLLAAVVTPFPSLQKEPRIPAMTRATEVPVAPSVLEWAIDQSGFKPDDLARSIGVDTALLEAWLSGDKKPTLTEARQLAHKLHRPFSAHQVGMELTRWDSFPTDCWSCDCRDR